MPKEDTVDKFFGAVTEAYDALLDSVKSANDRGYRVSRRLIDDVERGQREFLDLARNVAVAPRDVSGLYSASIRSLTSAQGRLLTLTREFVDELSEGQREGRDTLRRVIEANRTAGKAAIEVARDVADRASTRVQSVRGENGRTEASKTRKARQTSETSS